jgi:hypothetical protein
MLTRTTRSEVEAYALAQAGRSRDRLPVPWTASPVMDDCAAFCSHVLWGGKPGPILWVDNFKTAGDGTYAAGSSDLAPWVGDLGNGYVTTYGANGSDSREARYRTRPKHYILGRFRPAWAPTGAPLDHHLTNPTHQEEDDMYTDKDRARDENIERLLSDIQNAIGDPKRGLAARAVATLVLVQKIAKRR